MKVFGLSEKAGLWYLIKQYEGETSRICSEHSILLEDIRGIAPKLKLLRDKTHFHLDAKGVQTPEEIWKAANISRRELDASFEAGFALLRHLHKQIRGEDYELPDYDGKDATRILQLADHADLFCHPLSNVAAVTYFSADGFWLLTSDGERFLAFWDYPCFRDASVRQILNVQEPSPGHYRWPDLDIDLSLKIIHNPAAYPLTAKVK